MDGQYKRKRSTRYDLSNSSHDQDDLTRTNQTLPVADLPAGFDGIPTDGAQYLAIVRQESSTVPAVSFAINPYAKAESRGSISAPDCLSWTKDESDFTCMPSLEWRKSFLSRFSNMRNALAIQRAVQHVRNDFPAVPKGESARRWYRFLHGRDTQLEIEYDNHVDAEGIPPAEASNEENANSASQALQPSEALLHQLAPPQMILLLSMIPYWLTQPYIDTKAGEGKAVDPFHARWMFSLLAHLEEQLVGDDISVLRTLARACFACIIKSRIEKGVKMQLVGADDLLQDEMGAWMVICAVAGIWGQHDIWDDGHRDLLQIAR